MSETTTTALYLFSSLLQADATILGFGAIFIIYKLEQIEKESEVAISQISLHGPGYMNLLTKVLNAASAEAAEEILKAHSAGTLDKLFRSVVASKRRPALVKSVLWPLLIIALHISCCAVFLWFTPQILFNEYYGKSIVSFIIVFFIIGVFWSVRFAWMLLRVDKSQ